MTSRERILTALSHEQPDRCPTYIWIHGDCLTKLIRASGVANFEELEDHLGIDKWRDVGIGHTPQPDAPQRIRDFVPPEFISDPELTVWPDGAVTRNHPDIHYLDDYVFHPLQNACEPADVLRYPLPKPATVEPATENLIIDISNFKAEGCVVSGGITQPYKLAARLRGMENLLCDFLVDPFLVNALYDILYDFETAKAVSLTSAGVDIISMVGDIAMQDRLMMGPDLWRIFDKPRLARLIKAVKEVNPRVLVYMHSDGNMRDIIPDLIEVGLDILNPIQPECMDLAELKREFGNDIVLHGGVSLQRTIPFGTVDDVRREVTDLVKVLGEGGGYVLGPSNVFIPEFPIENIIAVYETAKDL